MATLNDYVDQRDAEGNLTPLALALNALGDHGCDCGTDESGSCLACLCEAALLSLLPGPELFCPDCDGRGTVDTGPCDFCKGTGGWTWAEWDGVLKNLMNQVELRKKGLRSG